MFDFIFEFVAEVLGEAVLEGLCFVASGSILCLADVNRPLEGLNLDRRKTVSGRDDAAA
jgi:hypothetical protein